MRNLSCFIFLTCCATLYLDSPQITDEGVKKLQLALPNCKIYH